MSNVLAIFGIYTTLAYYRYSEMVMLAVLTLTGGTLYLWILYIVLDRRKLRAQLGEWLGGDGRRRVIGCAAEGVLIIAACGAVLIFIVAGAVKIRALIRVRPTKSLTVATEEEEAVTIDGNIDALLCLEDGTWEYHTDEEKLNVLQTVADIERYYFGLPGQLDIAGGYLGKSEAGYYDDSIRCIVVNLDYLRTESPEFMIKTVCHEAYHSYQHRMVEVYRAAQDKNKQLLLLRRAGEYEQDFANYKSDEESFLEYYLQACEVDAREYATDAAIDYVTKIRGHLGE